MSRTKCNGFGSHQKNLHLSDVRCTHRVSARFLVAITPCGLAEFNDPKKTGEKNQREERE
jgi:hypothetical protein